MYICCIHCALACKCEAGIEGQGQHRVYLLGQNQLTRATLLKIMRLKRLWANPLPHRFHSSACFSLSHITDPQLFEKPLARGGCVVWQSFGYANCIFSIVYTSLLPESYLFDRLYTVCHPTICVCYFYTKIQKIVSKFDHLFKSYDTIPYHMRQL